MENKKYFLYLLRVKSNFLLGKIGLEEVRQNFKEQKSLISLPSIPGILKKCLLLKRISRFTNSYCGNTVHGVHKFNLASK